jgi:hypothetical protein
LEVAPVPLLDPSTTNARSGGVKQRLRGPLKGMKAKRKLLFPVDQKKLNRHFDEELKGLGWEYHPSVVPKGSSTGPKTGLAADFKKGKLQVEIQFGNMARWYTDVFKFQLSYSLNQIDAAILVVPMQRLANLIDENIAYFERVTRELPHAKMSLTLPILVIGVEPESFSAVRRCYEIAARTHAEEAKRDGQELIVVPFTDRLAAEPEDTADGD